MAIAAILVHVPALQGERIWDDGFLTRDNPFIKSPLLILETFRHYLFPDSFSAHYRPVQNISYMLDYFFWNTDTWGFHLSNVLLHAGSSALLYFLLRELLTSLLFRQVSIALRPRLYGRVRWISLAAFCCALIWAVHPVHSAAVDYISGRADSLVFLFCAGGWLLFLHAQHECRAAFRASFYFAAVASGLLGLLSREIACVWIVLFLAHVLFIERKLAVRTRVCAVMCCSLVLAVYFGLRQLPQHRPPAAFDLHQSAPVRATFMARALGDYGRLMVFPGNLHMERTVEFDRSDPAAIHDSRTAAAAQYLSILGVVVAAVFVATAMNKRPGQALRVFGASWFIAAYLPISNIVQLNATAAEHWLYLPSVGFLIWLVGCAVHLPARYRRVLPVVALVAVVALGTRAWIRSGDWANEETFYKRTFAAGSRSARVAINLGRVYLDRKDYAQAEKIFRAVLQYNPDFPAAQIHLASVLHSQGKTAEAEQLYAGVAKQSAQTRKAYPHTWTGVLNLAHMRYSSKDNAAAVALLEKARRDYPQVWELLALESEILRETDHLDRGLQLVENFAQTNWWHYGAALALGRLYAQKDDIPRSEAALRRASRLDVHETQALNLIAALQMRQNRFDEAFRAQRRAVARQPDEPSQYILLSGILEKMGRADEARAALAHVSRLRALAQNQAVPN